jgi:hypothetical protein
VRYARTIKETQAKLASLIPPEPTTRNLLAGFLAQPRPCLDQILFQNTVLINFQFETPFRFFWNLEHPP